MIHDKEIINCFYSDDNKEIDFADFEEEMKNERELYNAFESLTYKENDNKLDEMLRSLLDGDNDCKENSDFFCLEGSSISCPSPLLVMPPKEGLPTHVLKIPL